jgi:hypothetical protein
MRLFLAFVLAVSALAAQGVRAEVTYDEAVCEVKATVASWNYFQKAVGCLVSCQRGVRAGSTDPADCVAPYAHQTFGCIQGKQGRANGSICSGCSRDTPECYPADPCPETTHEFLGTMDGGVVNFMSGFYCDDTGSTDGLTPYEAKCQDATAKYTAKAVYGVARCYAKCRQYEAKGLLTPGTCAPPTSDPYTLACLTKLDTATAYRIDRYCTDTGNQPECAPIDGAVWSQFARAAVEGYDPTFYCEN